MLRSRRRCGERAAARAVCEHGPVGWSLDIGAEQFEKLCQALARQLLGPAVRAVRPGPDGGRDAEFEGPVHYPGAAPTGSGTASVSSSSSTSPALAARKPTAPGYRRAVRETLEKLASRAGQESSARSPEYIVFATNLSLTASARDSVEEIVSGYAPRIGLRGWSIWLHDDICRFIELLPDVRYSYALGHDYLPADREQVEIGGLSRFELAPLGERPSSCPEIVPAWWRLVSTHDSVTGLFDTLYAARRAAESAELQEAAATSPTVPRIS